MVSSLLDLLFLTQIFRIQACAVLALVVAQRHPIPTAPTDDQSLKQGEAFPCRTVPAIFSVGGTILLQLMQIGFVLLPSDIPNVSTLQEKLPLILWNDLRMVRTVKLFRRARAPKAECSSVARIAKDFERRAVQQRSPADLAFVRAGTHPAGKEQGFCAKILHGGGGRAGAFEGREQQPNGLLNLCVRIKDDRFIFCVSQAHR